MAHIDRPVFVVGMGRSGTTLVFQTLATHPDFGWFSYYLERLPSIPSVALLSRICDLGPAFRKSVRPRLARRDALERLRDGPSEAYSVWERVCGERFAYSALIGERAPPAVREQTHSLVGRVLALQGKPRFLAKLTGPGRIDYLHSLFPDARFIHVWRDGRAVVESLLRTDFWRDTWRMERPAWDGVVTDDGLREWERSNRSPVVLAALQWRAVVEGIRHDFSALPTDQHLEVRFERFASDPQRGLRTILDFCELAPSPRVDRALLDVVPSAGAQRVPDAAVASVVEQIAPHLLE